MKGCSYSDGDDKPKMPKSSKGDIPDKASMKKGGKGSGEKLGHAVHHQNRPHGHKGPKSPEGY